MSKNRKKENEVPISQKYLILDEERNAYDFLKKSIVFLNEVDRDKSYLKWFVIAFHGAIYHFILLALQSANPVSIFTDDKNNKHTLDRYLISFKSAYKNLKEGGYIPKGTQNACMDEINNALRNQMLHFRPTLWVSEPWYFVNACIPLLEVLRYCFAQRNFINLDINTLNSEADDLERLLLSHARYEMVPVKKL